MSIMWLTELTKVSGSLLFDTKTAGVFLTVTEGPTQSISISPEPVLNRVSLNLQAPPERLTENPGPACTKLSANIEGN